MSRKRELLSRMPTKTMAREMRSLRFFHMNSVSVTKRSALLMRTRNTLSFEGGVWIDSRISRSSGSPSVNITFALLSVSGTKTLNTAPTSTITEPIINGIHGSMFMVDALIGVATTSATIGNETKRNNAVALIKITILKFFSCNLKDTKYLCSSSNTSAMIVISMNVANWSPPPGARNSPVNQTRRRGQLNQPIIIIILKHLTRQTSRTDNSRPAFAQCCGRCGNDNKWSSPNLVRKNTIW